MKQKFFAMFAAAVLLLGMSACVSNDDNPVTVEDEGNDFNDITELAIADGEFEPTDVSVALLGSLSSAAEEEVTRYWFPNVTSQVTDETMVVITDEITDGNKADIEEVLGRYGMLLLADPKEDNVRKYAAELGVDPNADYSKLELIGLTGMGDQFVSYNNGEEEASDVAPSSIASDDIWDMAPAEYLRLKAFAQWVDRIDKKYTEYQAYLQSLEDAILAADDEDEAQARAWTRADDKDKEKEDTGILNLLNLPGADRTAQAIGNPKFKSYDNVGRSDDEERCPLSVTCNYHFTPLYKFPEGKEPGSDYYIVETSVHWDCTETLTGWKKHDHGSGRDRRSFLFFPLECKFWSQPTPTSGNYKVQTTADGELWPGDVKAQKTVTNSRSFNIDGNVSGGLGGSREKGQTGNTASSNKSLNGNVEASLGIGASWNKSESFTVEEYNVSPYVSDAICGHIITIPGGDDGYRPRLVSRVNGGIEVPNGVNFRKSIPVSESWIWRVSGTQIDTYDDAISVTFAADVKVGWYSYFLPSHGLDCKENSARITAKKVFAPAPNRMDAGYLKILANTEENGKKFKIFAVKAIDVTDKDKPFVYLNKDVSTSYGKTLSVGLPANKTYNIELQMGSKRTQPHTYVLEGWKVAGRFETVELDTDSDFDLKE